MGAADAVLAANLVRQNATPSGVSAFLHKLRLGKNVSITFVGDSILNGSTAGSPGAGAGAGGAFSAVAYTGAVVADNDAASLLCNALAAAYGITVTKRNRAVGGTTVAYWMANYGTIAGLNTESDLYVIGFGKNDIAADQSPGTLGGLNGYPLDASLTMLEWFIRRLQYSQAPGVLPPSVLFLGTNPYGAANESSNAYLQRYNRGMEQLARAYGHEFADGYASFPSAGASRDALLSDGTHPNTAGHALLYQAMVGRVPLSWPQRNTAPLFPSPLPTIGVGTLGRPTRNGIPRVTTQSFSGAGIARFFTATGTGQAWTGTGPYTNTGSTGGAYASFLFKGTECFLDLVGGSGQGKVHIDIDGSRAYTSLDLSTMANGKIITLTALGGGVHTVVVEVTGVAGTVGAGTAVTVNGFWHVAGSSEFIPGDSARIAASVGTVSTAAQTGLFDNAHGASGSVTGTTYTFDFIGTAVELHWQRLVGSHNAICTVDGVAQSAVTIGLSGTVAPAPAYGGVQLVSGLDYGRHTISVAVNGGSGMVISGFLVYDEARLARPTKQCGIAKQGEAIVLPIALSHAPDVTFRNVGSNGTAFYATSISKTGFTIAGGVSGDWAWWEASSADRVTA